MPPTPSKRPPREDALRAAADRARYKAMDDEVKKHPNSDFAKYGEGFAENPNSNYYKQREAEKKQSALRSQAIQTVLTRRSRKKFGGATPAL